MSKICSENIKDTWKVATTFIGTIVGAGFASGQEILKFFSHFGYAGIIGLMLSTVLFCILGTIIMFLGRRLQAASFGEVVRHVCGRWLGPIMDFLLGLFLFGSLSVMLAGSGAVFFQQWGLSYSLGTCVTVIVSIIIVLFGIKGIIRANTVVVPLMVTICLLAVTPAISGNSLLAMRSGFVPAGSGASSQWFLSALLYVSYNITLGVSVLAPLGREIKNPRSLLWGGVLGGLSLGAMAMLINLAILSHYPDSSAYEIPSLFVAGRLAYFLQLIFSFVLWAEIFTTIIGTVYGLSARLSDGTGFSYRTAAVVLMLAALALSQFGFSGLVGTLYPLFGYVSFVFLAALLVFPILNRK